MREHIYLFFSYLCCLFARKNASEPQVRHKSSIACLSEIANLHSIAAKKIIYLYLSYLLILHIGGILGPVLSWVLLLDAGYYVSSATNIFYIASFSPLLYYAFLWDFFHTGEDEEGETLHSVPIYYTPINVQYDSLYSSGSYDN